MILLATLMNLETQALLSCKSSNTVKCLFKAERVYQTKTVFIVRLLCSRIFCNSNNFGFLNWEFYLEQEGPLKLSGASECWWEMGS